MKGVVCMLGSFDSLAQIPDIDLFARGHSVDLEMIVPFIVAYPLLSLSTGDK
jgi:hypothetical protein